MICQARQPTQPTRLTHCGLPGSRLPTCRFFSAQRRARPPFVCLRSDLSEDADRTKHRRSIVGRRREFVLVPSLGAIVGLLSSVAAARAEEKAPNSPTRGGGVVGEEKEKESEKEKETEKEKGTKEEGEESVLSRVYDATVIGEPQAVGKDKKKVWEKLLAARVVYLGEAELVPERDDRVLELEIVRNLFSRCSVQQRSMSVALKLSPAIYRSS
ncbi:hypothetical protein HPP92_019196 [Vanilla planifolia]|uniref:Uncharacterized protein n=1 Tax=Vanilla planifolia TaxID=51239 RepID=A0A835Q932_VANPL|nr:hypothetical protein HPP92_019705 [Vanilla planifolia]KAG0465032.1 hypothetical protein HPP92_019196 [Vanilla planifolia]